MDDITVNELKTRIESGDDVALIDVRQPQEHDEYNIGGRNLPLGDIGEWCEQLEMPAESEIVVYCESGNRSAMAKGILISKGFTAVRNLTGGIVAWAKM